MRTYETMTQNNANQAGRRLSIMRICHIPSLARAGLPSVRALCTENVHGGQEGAPGAGGWMVRGGQHVSSEWACQANSEPDTGMDTQPGEPMIVG